MPSFLIVKTSAIGDVIQTFPVLEYLRTRFPEARIDWVVERSCFDLVKAHPALSHAFPIDTKAWRKKPFGKQTLSQVRGFYLSTAPCLYDAVFDLQGNAKSAFITAMARAKEKIGFSWGSAPEKLNLLATTLQFKIPKETNARSRYLALVQKYFRDEQPFESQGTALKINFDERMRIDSILAQPNLQGEKWMVSFGSRWPNKQLQTNTLKELLKKIQNSYGFRFLFIWGNPEEKKEAEALQSEFLNSAVAVGELSLPQWQVLMTRMDGVIATDSAGLHLAGSAGVSTFSFFGPSSSAMYQPIGIEHASFQGTCPYGQQFVKRCPQLRTCSTGACLKNLNVDELFQAFQAAVQNRYSVQPSRSPLSL